MGGMPCTSVRPEGKMPLKSHGRDFCVAWVRRAARSKLAGLPPTANCVVAAWASVGHDNGRSYGFEG